MKYYRKLIQTALSEEKLINIYKFLKEVQELSFEEGREELRKAKQYVQEHRIYMKNSITKENRLKEIEEMLSKYFDTYYRYKPLKKELEEELIEYVTTRKNQGFTFLTTNSDMFTGHLVSDTLLYYLKCMGEVKGEDYVAELYINKNNLDIAKTKELKKVLDNKRNLYIVNKNSDFDELYLKLKEYVETPDDEYFLENLSEQLLNSLNDLVKQGKESEKSISKTLNKLRKNKHEAYSPTELELIKLYEYNPKKVEQVFLKKWLSYDTKKELERQLIEIDSNILTKLK